MKVWTGRLALTMAGMLALAGCASIGPPEAPSLELPKPPIDLRAARKGDRVTLTWTVPSRTTERQSVKYMGKTQICRSLTGALKQCGTAVGNTAPPGDFETARRSGKKLTARFIDTLPSEAQREHPRDFATYAVEVLNDAGRGAGLSNQVRVPLVPTLPPFRDFSAKVVAQGVFISWRCEDVPGAVKDGVKYWFRIYRRPAQSESEAKIADQCALCVNGPSSSHSFVDAPPEKQRDFTGSFLDQTFDWEKTYFYRGTVVSVIEAVGKPTIEVEGEDTPEVKVFAHDIFPPAVPSGLQAVSSGPGQQPFIDLIWTAVTDADLSGYNVYRHEDAEAPVRVNQELVKTPAFRDTRITSGKTYFYSVSAVDERGNESARSEETAETVGP